MSLFNISFTRKFLQLFSGSNNVLCNSSEIAQNILLISANNHHADELTEQLNTWGYQVEHYHSTEEALCRLTDTISRANFKALIFDHRHLSIDPKWFIEKLHHSLPLPPLTTILVGPQPSKHEQVLLKKAGYHFQVATPLDTRRLFSALHTPVENIENCAGISNLLDKFNDIYPRLSAKKILLAAQDNETVDLAKNTLEKQGHTVSVAKDGQQALLALETTHFDITIIEKELPLLSGIQVVNIHHLDCQSDQWMPFILLLEEGSVENYPSSQVKAYLAKPINSQQLIKTLYNLAQQQSVHPKNIPCKQPPTLHHMSLLNAVQETTLVEQTILEELNAMSSSSHFIHQLIHLFEEDGKRTLQELYEAVASDDFAYFKEIAHLLLDSSSFLGTTRLYELSLHATQINKREFTESAESILRGLEETFNMTTTELFQYLSKKTDSLSNS